MKSQSGNALFLTLIGIVLFGALSYALTQSGQTSGSIDQEQASLMASDILQYAQSIENAVASLRISGGCSETDISFNHDFDGDGSYIDADDVNNNPTSPSDLSCHVFHPNGGGIEHVVYLEQPYSQISAPPAFGQFNFWPSTVLGAGQDDRNDLVMTAASMNPQVCRAINRGLNVPLPDGEVPNDPFTTMEASNTNFQGSFRDDNIASVPHAIGDGAGGVLDGVTVGCPCQYGQYSGTTCNNHVFYYTIVSR